MSEGAATQPVTIFYDGQCPFCSAYVGLVRLRAAAGEVRLVDARSGAPALADAAGFDLNAGMLVTAGAGRFYGADAVHWLALMSTRAGFFNRLAYVVFRHPRLTRLLYPGMRGVRNLTLRVLGRPPL
ncbi:MAG TPA: DCC1-like thiol-disulfide oxidoreductase family protein [Hyphomicrobiales bacterium]|nr:DCC1-like thiol-disulfide oxidoreductase family protein [Hyphomicrobiales bacterium]